MQRLNIISLGWLFSPQLEILKWYLWDPFGVCLFLFMLFWPFYDYCGSTVPVNLITDMRSDKHEGHPLTGNGRLIRTLTEIVKWVSLALWFYASFCLVSMEWSLDWKTSPSLHRRREKQSQRAQQITAMKQTERDWWPYPLKEEVNK